MGARPVTAAAEVLAIWLRPAARLPVRAVGEAIAVANVGLDGDHAVAGRRQITLLAIEAWTEACAQLGRDVDPAVRRANVLTRGIDLAGCIGRTLRIGDAEVEIVGETRPCELLDDQGRIGLSAALRPDRRAGVHGIVRRGGVLRIGAAISVVGDGA